MNSSKLLLALAIALFCLPFFASLSVSPGSAEAIPGAQQRDVQASYHRGQDDYHLYGSTQWAVRFDFQDFYPNVPNCRFITSKARIFFPNAASSATVSLYADADSLPTGNALRQVSGPITNQTMEFEFPDTLSASVVWLLVDYIANGVSSYVSASAGGGAHSFYLNTIAPVPFLQSMRAAGISCELAFGLIGSFALDSPDLELISFSLLGDVLPRGHVRPSFSVYNHSDSPVNDARIRLEFTSPDAEYAFRDSIVITNSIPSRDSLVISAPGYAEYSYELPETPSQLKVKATLVSSFAEPDNLFQNNIITTYYSVYADSLPFFLVENFMLTNSANAVLSIQDEVLSDAFCTLNYFPSQADSLGNLASRNRFDWYYFNTYPTLAICGTERIYGLPPAYHTRLQTLQDNVSNGRTFISRHSAGVNTIPNSENLLLNFSLTNGQTLLYEGATLNPALQSQFFAGLFKKLPMAGRERYVLQRWIAFADTIGNPLPPGNSIEKSYTFSHPNISPDELISEYTVFYWLQNRDGGLIHFAAAFNFSPDDFPVSIEDPLPSAKPLLYPNPLFSGANLQVHSLEKGSRIEIYNLKGQLIYSEANSKHSLMVSEAIFPTSGIYFVRIKSPHAHKAIITKKISYIK